MSPPVRALGITDNATYTPPMTGPYGYYTWNASNPNFIAPGESYVDPVFGVTITRLTDAYNDGSTLAVFPQYSQTSSWNLDNTYMVLGLLNGGMRLYDSSGNFSQMQGVGLSSRPRWSRINPNWLYYRSNGNTQLRRLNVLTGDAVDIGPQFSGTIDFARYGDLSDDDRAVIVRDNRYVSIWDLINGVQVSSQELDTAPIGSMGGAIMITKDGDSFLIDFGIRGTSRGEGLEQFDVDGNFMVQIFDVSPHGSMGRDVDGSQVYFVTNPGTRINDPPNCINGIIKITLDGTATRTCLLSLKWMPKHLSGHGSDGWVYISTVQAPAQPQNPGDDLFDQTQWHAYTNEIFRIRADGSVIERLAHTRSSNAGFWVQPHANIGVSGDRVVWGSDFMMNGTANYVDTYMIDLTAQPGSPVCGDGTVDAGEACDDGSSNGACPGSCSSSCTLNVCSGNLSLTLWDTDETQSVLTGDQAFFYASYEENNVPVVGATCSIVIPGVLSSQVMTFDPILGIHFYQMVFSSPATHTYSVQCAGGTCIG